MIAPPPFKWKCPKCGYSKIIKPKGDVLDPMMLDNQCPKCGEAMETKPLNTLEQLLNKF